MSGAVFYGVGIGPGDPELLTLKAVRVLRECPVIAAPRTPEGGMLALEITRKALSLEGKRILPLEFAMSRDPKVLEERHKAAAALVLKQLRAGDSVAMLNIGDVSIYATYQYLKEIVEEQGFPTVMIPGVPSFCAVAARLGQPLTRQMNAPLHIIPAGFSNLEEALAYPGTKVVMKAGKPLLRLKEALKKNGRYHKARLVRNCGLPGELVAHSLDEAGEEGAYFTTVVVRP